MPAPAPAEQVNLAAGRPRSTSTMKDAQVTEEHLEKSNEPELQEAAAAKKEAEAHAAAAPRPSGGTKSQTLQAGSDRRRRRRQEGRSAPMTKDKTAPSARSPVRRRTRSPRTRSSGPQISGEINQIFDKTKIRRSTAILQRSGRQGRPRSSTPARRRRAASSPRKHKSDMEKYKDERYSGACRLGAVVEDLFSGLPAEANKIYDDAKALYESKMTVVISQRRRSDRRRTGRGEEPGSIWAASRSRTTSRQQADEPAEAGDRGRQGRCRSKFDQLESDVDSKQQSLVDDLANKYVEAQGKVDEEIKAEQEKNKGLVDKAKDAVMRRDRHHPQAEGSVHGPVVEGGRGVHRDPEDPIKFISNFMSAVKQGFMSFVGNILTHLKKGLLGWLFGALADAGIELPDSFDLKGILKLVGSILGLTWTNIKTRIVKIAPWVGKVIDVIESKIEIFKILATQGIAGLWNWIKEKLGDLKRTDHHADQGIRDREDRDCRDLLGARDAEPGGRTGEDRAGADRGRAVDHGARRRPDGLHRHRHRCGERYRQRWRRGSAGQDRGRAREGRAAGHRFPGQPARLGWDLRQDQVDPEGGPGADQQGTGLR